MNKHTPDQKLQTEAWKTECIESIDELARQGAHRMILAALEAEVEDYLEHHRALRDQQGHAQVVRNGKSRERTFTLGVGPPQFQAPRVNDRRGGHTFHSAVLPPYLRRSPRLETALPVLYLKGLATGDFQEALSTLFGQETPSLSATTITRLLQVWQGEYEVWRKRPLQDKDYIYLWADGVYFGVRLEEEKLACLVLVGVLPDGTKEVIALEDGYRESKESWASLLRDLKERGMKAPAVATGDGALGFWAALAEVYPQTREQRCWVHKTVNVLDRLPKRLQLKAKEMLQEIVRSPDRKSATEEMDHFAREFRAAYPKAVECLRKDRETLLTFYDFPAEHWIHLRTTNPIESSFASVKSRTRQTKGAGSRKAGLAMAYKLILMAQDTWRKITAPHLLPLLRAGVRFEDGKQVQETPEAGKTTTVYLSPPWFEGLTFEEQGVAMSGVAA